MERPTGREGRGAGLLDPCTRKSLALIVKAVNSLNNLSAHINTENIQSKIKFKIFAKLNILLLIASHHCTP